MAFKVTKTNIPKDAIKQVRDEFSKSGAAKHIRKDILDDLSAGVSPVEGEKWKKYSESYKSVIRGQKTFRKKGGKVFVKNEPDEAFLAIARLFGKSIAPVNLKLSGELWKSLKVNIQQSKIIIAFTDFLAEIHNNLGAGKSRTIRKLLPTEAGEKLNSRIMQGIIERLQIAVDTVVKRINRQ
jgi:hypothetical protein